jgi:hypothetical protein
MPVTFDEAAACARVFDAVDRQVDLARKLELTPAAISNLKRRKKCTLDLVLAAGELTGRPVEWFLFGDRPQGVAALRQRAKGFAGSVKEARRKSSAAAKKLRDRRSAVKSGDEQTRLLFQLFDDRLTGLEEWVRALETRLVAVEEA